MVRIPREDDEGPGPRDADLTDDERTETVACPACGVQIYENADRCPLCGEYVVTSGKTAHRRSGWWVLVALALIAGLLLMVLL